MSTQATTFIIPPISALGPFGVYFSVNDERLSYAATMLAGRKLPRVSTVTVESSLESILV